MGISGLIKLRGGSKMLDIYEGIIFDVAIPKQDVHEKICVV